MFNETLRQKLVDDRIADDPEPPRAAEGVELRFG
jgi:hypothetical protein